MASWLFVSFQVLSLVMSTGISRSVGAIPKSLMREVEKINEDGPFLGLVVPNAFELNPLLQSESFTEDRELPFIDLDGRRFRFGTIGKEKVIVAMTGLSMLNAGLSTQLLLSLFNVRGVVHFGTAGLASSTLRIGDVVIPRYWAHTGLWNWQRYGDGPNEELGLESFGDYTREIGYLEFSDYSNTTIKDVVCGNLLNRVWYQPEEIFPINGVPEVREHAFWVPVDDNYYAFSQKLEGIELKRCINSTTCLPRSPMVVRVERGCSGNIFVSNQAYKQFLSMKFNITILDMESSAVALVCLQQRIPFIALRAISGGGSFGGKQAIATFTSLVSENVVYVTTKFVSLLGEAGVETDNNI